MAIATRGTRAGARRRAVAVALIAGVAAIHVLRAGSYLRGTEHRLYYSYASDVLLPFTMYFVLCLSERRLAVLGDWRAKALMVLAAASGAEVLQGFGVPMLGRTFDPLDFVMYGLGVLGALVVDRVLSQTTAGRPDGGA
jgi:hypothetical protein